MRVLLVAVALPFLGACSLVRGPTIYDRWSHLVAEPAEPGPGTVTATFFGVSTLLFDDGETRLLIDGFFSRPGRLRLLLNVGIQPDDDRIRKGLDRGSVRDLAAILVGHSHFDHAMDVARVARETGGVVVGSTSTRNIALGDGLADDRICIVEPETSIGFGAFTVTFLQSSHVPLSRLLARRLDPDVPKRLWPPARMGAYGEGGTYSILIEHPGGTALVQGSAGFVPGALDEVSADVVFLGIGQLNKQSPAYANGYWQHVVQAIGPDRVFLIHWDDFSRPLDKSLRALPRRLDDVDASFRDILERAGDALEVQLLPFAKPVELYGRPSGRATKTGAPQARRSRRDGLED